MAHQHNTPTGKTGALKAVNTPLWHKEFSSLTIFAWRLVFNRCLIMSRECVPSGRSGWTVCSPLQSTPTRGVAVRPAPSPPSPSTPTSGPACTPPSVGQYALRQVYLPAHFMYLMVYIFEPRPPRIDNPKSLRALFSSLIKLFLWILFLLLLIWSLFLYYCCVICAV